MIMINTNNMELKNMNAKLKTLLIALLVSVAGFAQKSPVDKLFEKYANREGLTTVNISGTLLGLASGLTDQDSPESKVLSGLDGIRILTVDDSTLNQSLDFYQELEKDGFFRNNTYEVLMEITEKDEVVRFLGKNAGKGKLSELLLVVGGDDNTLISIRGLISPEDIAQITKSLNIDITSGKGTDKK